MCCFHEEDLCVSEKQNFSSANKRNRISLQHKKICEETLCVAQENKETKYARNYASLTF